MNFTQSFQEFSTKLGPTDLALYAGVGIILWVLFQDKLTPIQKLLLDIFNSSKKIVENVPIPNVGDIVHAQPPKVVTKEDLFFDLVVSWKQTRDLAVKSGCKKAIEVADQMFPYLSPTVCSENKDE